MIKKVNNSFIFFDCGAININDVNVSFKKASSFLKPTDGFVQFFSTKVLSSEEQILHAFDNAFTSFFSKKPFSKSLFFEFLMFLTAQRQLENALKLLELNNGKNEVCVIVFSEDKRNVLRAKKFFKKELFFVPQKNAVENNLKKNFEFLKTVFEINEKELNALALFGKKEKALQVLVLEKIALLSLKK